MEATPYTVPSTTTATDSTTGVRHRFTAGEVITMQRAVNHGLPGAALPAAPSPFTTAEEARILAIAKTLTLDDLSDVTITDAQTGDVLTYDAEWENA